MISHMVDGKLGRLAHPRGRVHSTAVAHHQAKLLHTSSHMYMVVAAGLSIAALRGASLLAVPVYQLTPFRYRLIGGRFRRNETPLYNSESCHRN